MAMFTIQLWILAAAVSCTACAAAHERDACALDLHALYSARALPSSATFGAGVLNTRPLGTGELADLIGCQTAARSSCDGELATLECGAASYSVEVLDANASGYLVSARNLRTGEMLELELLDAPL